MRHKQRPPTPFVISHVRVICQSVSISTAGLNDLSVLQSASSHRLSVSDSTHDALPLLLDHEEVELVRILLMAFNPSILVNLHQERESKDFHNTAKNEGIKSLAYQ